MTLPTDNDIAPLSRPPRDLLEYWQERFWKQTMRSIFTPPDFKLDYSQPTDDGHAKEIKP